jgi:Uncharacterised nucleotidyltransferase
MPAAEVKWPEGAAALRGLLGRWLVTGELPTAPDGAQGSRLAAVAGGEGLAGLLHEAIDQGQARWPETARKALRQAVHDDFSRGVRQLDTAGRVQDVLGTCGARCLPLKGAALVERLYDSVAHRPMVDIDLLVLDDWPRAVKRLGEAGFRARQGADHALTFIDPVFGTGIELHRGVTSCARLFPIDVDAVWARCRSGIGLIKRVPSSEDLLVHLSLHAAFQHGLALRLVQFLDFRRLLERDPPDLALLAELACKARAERAVALSLEAARAVVAAPISPGLEKLIAAWLPISLRRYLASWLGANPWALFTPAAPRLAWIRWQLADGRRLALVRETLSPSRSASPAAVAGGAAGRALGLARRWTLPTLRSLRANR